MDNFITDIPQEQIQELMLSFMKTRIGGNSKTLFEFAKKYEERGIIRIQFENITKMLNLRHYPFQFILLRDMLQENERYSWAALEYAQKYDPNKEFVAYIEIRKKVSKDESMIDSLAWVLPKDAEDHVEEKYKVKGISKFFDSIDMSDNSVNSLDTLGLHVTRNGMVTGKFVFCNQCKKELIKAKKCSSCKMVYYCDIDCQREDWSKHKTLCKQMQKKKE